MMTMPMIMMMTMDDVDDDQLKLSHLIFNPYSNVHGDSSHTYGASYLVKSKMEEL